MKLYKHKPVYAMANIVSRESGQPFDLWIDSQGSDRTTKHNCIRVKAKYNNTEVEVGFDKGEYTTFKTSESDLRNFKKSNDLKTYIIKMKPALEMHWNHELSDAEFGRVCVLVKKGSTVDDAIKYVIEER